MRRSDSRSQPGLARQTPPGAGGGFSGGKAADPFPLMGPDYDAEARKLFAQLGIAGTLPGPEALTADNYRNLDCVYQHPNTGAKVFIGNIDAAKSFNILKANGIRRVINCQDTTAPNFHEKNPEFQYFRFPVAWWQRAPNMDTDEGVLRFFAPVFSWVDECLASGEHVMIHCLAGAHRAGTTGVATVMHLTKADFRTALVATKRIRPAVDPIMNLGELLQRLDRAMKSKGHQQRLSSNTGLSSPASSSSTGVGAPGVGTRPRRSLPGQGQYLPPRGQSVPLDRGAPARGIAAAPHAGLPGGRGQPRLSSVGRCGPGLANPSSGQRHLGAPSSAPVGVSLPRYPR